MQRKIRRTISAPRSNDLNAGGQRPRYQRREIRVGKRVVRGVVCPLCILPAVIFPPSDLETHIARHGQAAPAPRYRRGRPPGSVNRKQMSSTGVENKRGIRGAV
jgi:hypothetical protein